MNDIDPGVNNKRAYNRYAKIHVLFRKIAEAKGFHNVDLKHNFSSCEYCNLDEAATKVKNYWKNFMKVSSLTELSDTQLKEMTLLIEIRLKHLNNKYEE